MEKKHVKPLGGTQVRIGDSEYDIKPEIQNATTITNYTFETMVDEDLITFAKILQFVNYNPKKVFISTQRKHNRNQLKKMSTENSKSFFIIISW